MLSVVIPVFNEEETLNIAADKVKTVLKKPTSILKFSLSTTARPTAHGALFPSFMPPTDG